MEFSGTKEAKVAKVWEFSGGFGASNPRFLRPFNDWEMERVQNFISITSSKKIPPLKRDRPFWKGDQNGHFNVKAYFKMLEGGSFLSAPVKVLWNPYVPTKVGFFAWEAW